MSAFWACWCRCRVLLEGAAVRVVCVRALERACWCRCRVRVLNEGAAVDWCVRFGAGMLVPLAAGCHCMKVLLSVVCALWGRHAAAAAGCCLRVLLSEWCVRFGAGMLVPLAAGCRCLKALLSVLCALWGGHPGAAAGRRCRVPLQSRCGAA